MSERIRNNKSDSVSKKTTYEDIKLPKNLRQVGQAGEKKRIYIEDYVMTYIQQLAMKNDNSYQVAVLLGKNQMRDHIDTIFISGAVEVKDIDLEDERVFSNEAWTKIYADIKEYFEQVEVVGWYITKPGLSLEADERITKAHLDNFAGSNKVLLMYDSVEREEAFYLYYNDKLIEQPGYYIYYEKNAAMQNYMVEHKEKKSVESSYVDKAGMNIRTVLDRKSGETKGKQKGFSVRSAVASVAALFLLIIAATMLSGIKVNKSKDKETSGVVVAQATKDSEVKATEDATTVNVKPGEGTSIKEDEDSGGTDVLGNEATTSIVPKQTMAPEATSKSTAGKEKKDSGQDVDVIIDGTSPVPKETIAPKSSESSKPSGQKEVAAPADEKVHKVIKGETLGSISLKYYKTKEYIKKIMELNDIKDADKIYEGQKLKLPDK
ncbi:MAG: LysM peptidoglycan-binding domain-containing protein [bacterium]|nr:LysM peptidoglycan-binding domain-containing protein [bacterium]